MMSVKPEPPRDRRNDSVDIDRLMQGGDDHMRQGRGTEADACFREVLTHQPDNPDALQRRGFLAFLRGDPSEAVELLSQAMAIRSDNATLCGHLASALMACGDLDEAISYWQRAVELAPDYAAAYVNLGDAYFAKSEIALSEAAYRKSTELAPDNPKGFVGLARMLHFSDRGGEAESALHQALELGEDAPEVWNLVGRVLLETGRLDAALELFEASVRKEPTEPQGHAGKGIALHMLARPDEARIAYRRALDIDPGYPLALKHLGVLLQECGELDAAAECFRQLLAADPNDDMARHMLAATAGEATSSAPAGYVTRLFDDYADRFDTHLSQISYRVPELIRDAVVDVTGSDRLSWRIMDLGCGTGLCGELLRPLATFLAGADLSPRMIAKSRERKIYDSLVTGSIENAFEGQGKPFDLVVAGDVFTYIGDLTSAFAGSARALRPGGLMAFSIEHGDGDTYQLRPTGRYAHSPAYVEDTANSSALSVVCRRDVVLREDPEPIRGQIVVLARNP